MHRIAIGDPQCVRHQPFAMLRIWMVDGETVWQELYPRGCGSLGLIGCGHCRCLVEVWNCVHVDISLGHAHRKARAVRQRAGDHSLWRAGATSIVGKDFLPAIAPKSSLLGWAMGVLLRDDGIVPLICPTCQNVFAGFAQSIHASAHHATLHGVVFDILVGSESRVGPCGCVAAPRVALSWK